MRELIEHAVARRAAILTDGTDALRWIDCQGDGLPGVFLESHANRWLLSTSGRNLPTGLREWLEERGHSCYWKTLDDHQKESPVHLCGPLVEAPFLMRENHIRYEISYQSGYSQGIFLDQRDNRAAVRAMMRPGLRLLNTFAYTGAFSVAAAMAGAETTTLDLSQPYLDWARRNFTHNGLDPAAHHFCKGDTFHWLRRFAKQGRRFDAIVLDPPTFSRDDKGRVFRVEKDFGELAALAAAVLAGDGWILCCTNFRGISPADFQSMVLGGLQRRMKPRHSPMPADFTAPPYLKSLWLEAS